MQLTVPDREVYVPSGKVGVEFFLMAIPVAFAAAAVLAFAMYLFSLTGFYFAIYVVALAAAGLSVVLAWCVRAGKCRNAGIASAYGALAGTTMYIGLYYLDMAAAQGPMGLIRVDAVPSYILWRLETDSWEMHPHAGGGPPPPTPVANWIIFGVELLIASALTGWIAMSAANRVFCESSGRWAVRRAIAVAPGSGAAIFDSLASGQMKERLAQIQTIRPVARQPFCQLLLEVCREENGDTDCCAYFSVRELKAAAPTRSGIPVVEGQGGSWLIRQCRLQPDEIAALEERFPELRG